MVLARVRRRQAAPQSVGSIDPPPGYPLRRAAGPVNPNRTGGSFRPPTIPPGFRGAEPLVKLLDERQKLVAQQQAAGARQAALVPELAQAKREDEADAIRAIRTGEPRSGPGRQHAVLLETAENTETRKVLAATRAAVEADIVRAVRDNGPAWRRDVEKLVAAKRPETAALRSKLAAAEAELRTLAAFAGWLAPPVAGADADDDGED